jgi:outer membrane receptor protein involved in Fe transport
VCSSDLGVGGVTYWDFGASYKVLSSTTLRVGVANAFDKQPPEYAPNVQSGTDPSLYDVIGRRILAQVTMKF